MLIANQITNESRLLLNRNVYERVSKAAPFIKFDADAHIVIDDDGILAAGKVLEETAWQAIDKAMEQDEKSIVNLFYGLNVSAKQLEYIEESIREKYIYTEVCKIPTEETIYDLSVSLE